MLIPATRYRDCDAALDFITRVLGLTARAVHRDDSGQIVHAQITLGQGMMMFGPKQSGGFDRFMVDPETAGGETTTIYAGVDNLVDRHAHVLACDGDVIMPLEAQDYGGSCFSVRDPEGHIWTFGDYDPWAAVD